jgi:hypothetical protein
LTIFDYCNKIIANKFIKGFDEEKYLKAELTESEEWCELAGKF